MPARKNQDQSSDALQSEKVTESDYLSGRINMAYQDLMSSALSCAMTITDRLFNPDGTATDNTYGDLIELSRCILMATHYGMLLTDAHKPEPEPEPEDTTPLMVFNVPFPPFSGPASPFGENSAQGISFPSGETIAQLFQALKADPRTNGAMDGVISNEEADDAILLMAEIMGVDPNILRGDDLKGFPVRTRENHKAWVEKWMGEDDYVLHFEDGTHHVYTRSEFTVSK